ncbi:MAG: hypothetical protein COB90_09200 [Hyphomicrobiales bacterium]|nr:MAG: hypothetical protein COB90_09200 [Hyphomicrobiales bacterium]
MRPGKLKTSIISWAILSPLLLLCLFPFMVMFFTAIKPQTEIYSPDWFTDQPQWRNFIDMWEATNFGTALKNSLYVSIMATLLALVAAIPAAYALARYRFAGKQKFRNFLMITQMLSPIVLILGLFRLMVLAGVLNDANAVAIIYAAFNLAFAVWMLESYFLTIPEDLEQAAWMEGAGAFTTLRRVFLPLALPAIVVTALFTFINSWNEFVIALTSLRGQENYTLPIQILSLVSGRYAIEWHFVMAATLVATLPIAIIFSWLQRYMVTGLTSGAVK